MNISELSQRVAELRKKGSFHEPQEMFLSRVLTSATGPIERAKCRFQGGRADIMSEAFREVYEQIALTSDEVQRVSTILGIAQ